MGEGAEVGVGPGTQPKHSISGEHKKYKGSNSYYYPMVLSGLWGIILRGDVHLFLEALRYYMILLWFGLERTCNKRARTNFCWEF